MKKIGVVEEFRNAKEVDNFATILLPSKSLNEKIARNMVATMLVSLNPSVDELSDIKTAVSEAITNSIVHGYKGTEGEIKICIKVKNKTVYVKIEDFGVGIEDIERAMQPFFTTGPENERSGMGFTVMETFMSEVFVSNQSEGSGLVVEMIKEFR